VAVKVGKGEDKEELLRQWVRCVMFCVEANCATVAVMGRFANRFFNCLDPTFIPPQRLPFMRIIHLLEKALFREFQLIVNDNYLLYGNNFVSTNSDFYTNSERRQSFGCLVSNMLAKRYVFIDHRKLFMSTRTFKEMAKGHVLALEEEMHDLETVLAFNQFGGPKTSKNIASWLQKGHELAGIKPSMISSHSTDGASNAVGSAIEYQELTNYLRETEIQHYTCFAHQVNRSARYASGTGDFATNQNEDMSAVLKKMHEINGRIFRSEKRLEVLFKVQRERGRYVIELFVIDPRF
jgi:hypothetical protein